MTDTSIYQGVDWRQLALRASSGDLRIQHLRRKRADGLTARVMIAPEKTAVLKLWDRRGIGARVRAATRTGPGLREWRSLRRLSRLGIRAPRPLYTCLLPRGGMGFTDAIFIEDLGDCANAQDRLKCLLGSGSEEGAYELEESLIAITATMVHGRLLDPDHRIINFLTTSDGSAVRVDMELARTVIHPALHPRVYGLMIGTLVSSHCFAVQPDVVRARSFALRLAKALAPSGGVLRIAKTEVDRVLDAQREGRGIDTRLELPW